MCLNSVRGWLGDSGSLKGYVRKVGFERYQPIVMCLGTSSVGVV